MTDQLLTLFRLCLLALVYLVFLRVLRAVWVELRVEQRADNGPTVRPAPTPVQPAAVGVVAAPTPAPMAPQTDEMSLVVVAPAERAGQRFVLHAETTIGRGDGCAVRIENPTVSKLHARVYRDEQGWRVEDLGSTNGTLLNAKKVLRPTLIGAGGRIQVGDVVMELS